MGNEMMLFSRLVPFFHKLLLGSTAAYMTLVSGTAKSSTETTVLPNLNPKRHLLLLKQLSKIEVQPSNAKSDLSEGLLDWKEGLVGKTALAISYYYYYEARDEPGLGLEIGMPTCIEGYDPFSTVSPPRLKTPIPFLLNKGTPQIN
jgi:hypothetical protein